MADKMKYKFRGKLSKDGSRGNKGDWIYGIPCYKSSQTYINTDGKMYEASEVDPQTVGLSVTITSNEYFEGDVVVIYMDTTIRMIPWIMWAQEISWMATFLIKNYIQYV